MPGILTICPVKREDWLGCPLPPLAVQWQPPCSWAGTCGNECSCERKVLIKEEVRAQHVGGAGANLICFQFP